MGLGLVSSVALYSDEDGHRRHVLCMSSNQESIHKLKDDEDDGRRRRRWEAVTQRSVQNRRETDDPARNKN